MQQFCSRAALAFGILAGLGAIPGTFQAAVHGAEVARTSRRDHGWLPEELAALSNKIAGVVRDQEGRPMVNTAEPDNETVHLQVCGIETRKPDGTWNRNHRPHCLLPRIAVDDTGRFAVPIDQPETRFNLWVNKSGYAPAFLSVTSQPGPVTVILRRGIQVSGHVTRRVDGKLQPVQGAVVHLQCAAGDLAQQKRVFENPSFFVMGQPAGDDLPYREHTLTGAFGEYVFELSPPPRDKQWVVVCLDELVPLEVMEGKPVRGPDFETTVRSRFPTP